MLARGKFGFAADEVAAALDMFRERGELVVPTGVAPALPDADDIAFLHWAVTAGAEFLVTGNKRHFPSEACGKVRVVNASELLDRITLEI